MTSLTHLICPDPAESSGLTHRQANSNGVNLHYVEMGSGPLVVLLHGFPEFWYAWRFQMPALADAGFRVIALDQRGYNTSSKPAGVCNYRLEFLADDVLGVIHAAGERSAAIVGHDWGGAVAWYFAMHHPAAVDRLIVLNAPHPQRFMEEILSFSQMRKSWYMLFFQLPWLPEWLIRSGDFAQLEHILRTDPVRPDAFDEAAVAGYKAALAQPGALTAALNYYRALSRQNPFRLMRGFVVIDAPTLVIWGEQDRYLGVRLTEGMDEWASDLRLARIPEASHWVQADVPARVNGLMIDFLRGGH